MSVRCHGMKKEVSPAGSALSARLPDNIRYSDPFSFYGKDDAADFVRPESDTIQYRHFTLDNGLEVVISCDPEASDEDESDSEQESTDNENEQECSDDEEEEDDEDEESGEGKKSKRKAACSMAVGVGSFEDPPDCQGLAHFLEHMVFMGTEKYPGENQWESFLSKRGGEDNAFTDAENTTYYFSIRPKHLQEALDRFAQFFIGPLFAENSAEREVRAIESEFQNVLQDEECRKTAVLCHSCSKHTPLWKFGWGNLKSLIQDVNSAGVDRQKLMKEFHRKWYYARNMKLFVFGSDLDSLESWVRESFSGIPAESKESKEPPKPIMCYMNPLEPGFKKYYNIAAVTDSFEISLNFHMPTRFGDWKCKPWRFLQTLVGHEGQGSLLANLRKEALATELSAGCMPDQGEVWNSLGILFSITVDVTEKGFDNKDLVIRKIFQYFDMLRNNTDKFEASWKEFQYLSGIRFHKMDRKDPVDKASEIATFMLTFQGPKKHLLSSPHIEFEYNHELTCEILDFFTPDLARIDVLRKGITGEIKEPWFGVDYSVTDVPTEVFDSWKQASNSDELFHMPHPNAFIPNDLAIKTSAACDSEIAAIVDDEFGRVFHKLDDKFKTPKTHYRINIEHSDAHTSVGALVAMDIYQEIFSFLMEEHLYQAYIAGIKYNYVMGLYGMNITVRGFSEHTDNVLLHILTKYIDLEYTESQFEMHRESHLRQLRNKNFDVSDHELALRDLFLTHFHITVADRIKCAERMTFAQFQQMVTHVLRNIYIRGLIHGNSTRLDAKNVLEKARQVLGTSCTFLGNNTNYRLIKIPSECTPIIERKVVNPEETNSFVCLRFQLGPTLGENHSFLELLYHIAYEPYFDQLRTKEQLGYSVWCSFEALRGIMYMSYNVQSSTHEPKHVRERIEQFVFQTFVDWIVDMSDEDFKQQVESLIEQKQSPYNNLREVTNSLYWEIKSSSYVWDRREKDVEFLQTITKQKFMDMYQTFVVKNGSHQRKLITCIYGKNHDMPKRSSEELFTTRAAENYLDSEAIFTGQEFVIDDKVIWKNCCETWPQFDRKFETSI